ncbi:pyridoxine 5'-phosphate synthase [bacterium]|nr:MAG: pyridoxine 5'-phosphate synthase [bacterium]
MARLLINIDHIATLRNARGEGNPNVLEAAKVCLQHGSEGIVFHLREDRRHIKDFDVFQFNSELDTYLDFEMAATNEMLQICSEIKPELSTLVPESRQELTTEGGLNLSKVFEDYQNRVIPILHTAEVPVSLFLDPNPHEIELASELGVYAVELHTGTYSLASGKARDYELDRLAKAAELIHEKGMKVNAGHGLNFENIHDLLAKVPHLHDISIGHAMIAEAVFKGLGTVVREMADIINAYKG